MADAPKKKGRGKDKRKRKPREDREIVSREAHPERPIAKPGEPAPVNAIPQVELYQGDRLDPAFPKKRAFLTAYVRAGTLAHAAEAAGVTPRAHYHWLETDPSYVDAYRAAINVAADTLESEAISRARDGWDEPVYQNGKLVGYVRKKSDTLLIFLLKGRRPSVFRERYEVTGKDGGPIQMQPVMAKLEELSTEDLERLRSIAAKAQSKVIGPGEPPVDPAV